MTAAAPTAASWPRPSFRTQLSDAASGAAVALPTPTARSKDCVDSTPAALPIAIEVAVHAE